MYMDRKFIQSEPSQPQYCFNDNIVMGVMKSSASDFARNGSDLINQHSNL